MSSSDKRPRSHGELEKQAAVIRAELKVPKQNDVFRCAVEAGYLAALSDGDVDAAERSAIVKAIELLSVGAVLEWEAEALLDECAGHVERDGAAKHAQAVGAALKALDQAEAGLLFAAFVADASGGVDKKETAVLEEIAKAAGIAKGKVGAILKKARAS